MRKYFLPLAASPLLIAGCDSASRCENSMARQALSPNRQHKAIVFFRGCGATTDESAQVSILQANADLPDASGNVFVVEESNVYVEWLGDSKLQVTAPPGVKTFFKATTCGSITVIYKVADANDAPGHPTAKK